MKQFASIYTRVKLISDGDGAALINLVRGWSVLVWLSRHDL